MAQREHRVMTGQRSRAYFAASVAEGAELYDSFSSGLTVRKATQGAVLGGTTTHLPTAARQSIQAHASVSMTN